MDMVTPNSMLTINMEKNHTITWNCLKYFTVKLMKLNMGPNFSFVHDNCTIHKTNEVPNYPLSQKIKIID